MYQTHCVCLVLMLVFCFFSTPWSISAEVTSVLEGEWWLFRVKSFVPTTHRESLCGRINYLSQPTDPSVFLLSRLCHRWWRVLTSQRPTSLGCRHWLRSQTSLRCRTTACPASPDVLIPDMYELEMGFGGSQHTHLWESLLFDAQKHRGLSKGFLCAS